MPRMTKAEFDAFQAKHQHAARPVLAALVHDDPDAGRFAAIDEMLTKRKAESGKRKPSPCCLVCGLENVCVCDGGVAAGQELELHNEIIRECRRRGWVYVHSNPSKRTRQTLGTPDFIIGAGDGRTLWIECKTAVGALSKDQKRFRDGLVANGHAFYVVRSLKRFKQIADGVFI